MFLGESMYKTLFGFQCRTLKELENIAYFWKKINAQVKVFKVNSDMNVYEELRNLKDYLHYRIKQREYIDKVVAATVNFEDF